MQNSKLKSRVTIVLTSLLGLTVVACSLPDPQKNGNGSAATFTLDTQDGSVVSADYDANFSIPVAKHISLKTCLKDRKVFKPIKSHNFIVHGGEKDQSLTTDGNGCLEWSEKIPYNHLADAALVELKRDLIANGVQKGTVTASWAFNPWQDQLLSLKDKKVDGLIKQDAADARLKGLDGTTGQPVVRPLILQDVVSNVMQKQLSANGTQYSIQLQAVPKIVVKDLSGEDVQWTLSQGKFQAKVYIIRSTYFGQAEKRDLIFTSEAIKIDKLIYGQMLAASQFAMSDCENSQFSLGLEVQTVGAPPGISSFSGIYALGTCDSMQGQNSLHLKNDAGLESNGTAQFSIQQYLTSVTPSTAAQIAAAPNVKNIDDTSKNVPGNGSGNGSSSVTVPYNQKNTTDNAKNSTGSEQKQITNNSPVKVDEIKAVAGDNVSLDDSSKQIHFILKICLKTNLKNVVLAGQKLKITGFSVKDQPATTLVGGCVGVEDWVPYDAFTTQCSLDKQVQVQGDEFALNEFHDVRLDVQLGANSATITLLDLTANNESADTLARKCAPERPAILANSFSLDKINEDYQLDQNLDLTITKQENLSMVLTMRRASKFTVDNLSQDRPPAGNYFLRWAIVDAEVVIKNVDDVAKATGKILSVGKEEFLLGSDGTFSQPISIPISNLKVLGSTNKFMFEITPKDVELKNHLENMDTLTFVAPINLHSINESEHSSSAEKASKDDHFVPIKPISAVVLPQIIAQFNMDKANGFNQLKATTSKEDFAKVNNYTLVNLNQPGNDPGNDLINYLKTGEVKAWLDTTDSKISYSMHTSLCDFWTRKILTLPAPGMKIPLINPKDGDTQDQIMAECFKAYGSDDSEPFFSVEYRYILDREKPIQTTFKDGKIENLTIMQSFTSYYSDTFAGAVGLAKDIETGVRADTPKLLHVLSLSASSGGRYTFYNENITKSKYVGDYNTIATNVQDNLQTINLQIHAEDYEKCALIKINDRRVNGPADKVEDANTFQAELQSYINVLRNSDIAHRLHLDPKPADATVKSVAAKILPKTATDEQKLQFTARTFMFCTGEKAGHPIDLDESHYIISQAPWGADIDSLSPHNRPYFIVLRGKSELDSFWLYIQRVNGVPKSYTGETERNHFVVDPILDAFSHKYDSYPGQVTERQ